MNFFEKYGQPQLPKHEGKIETFDALVDCVEIQRKLLEGELINNKSGKPTKSWFIKNRFSPKLGQFSLFAGKSIFCPSGEEKRMLDDFLNSMNTGEFSELIKVLDEKRKRHAESLAKIARGEN